MIGTEGKWKRITCREAKNFQDTNLIHWRPEYVRASMENPDEDPAFILEDIEEIRKRK
jgi:hypothetical protein